MEVRIKAVLNGAGLNASINRESHINATISDSLQMNASLDVGGVSVNTVPDYSGVYHITPADDRQVLDTTNKILRDDLTVERVPTWRTTNKYGGETFTIGAI